MYAIGLVELLSENDQGSKESDNFSFGGSGVYDDKVAAANAPRNDDAHEPVDADATEEQLKVANVARSPSFPNFMICQSSARGEYSLGGMWGRPRGWFCQSSTREEYSATEESKFICKQQGGGSKSRKTPPFVSKGQSLKQSTGW